MCLETQFIETTYKVLLNNGAMYNETCVNKAVTLAVSMSCSVIICVALGYMLCTMTQKSLFSLVVVLTVFSDLGELSALVLLYDDCKTMTVKHLFGVDGIPEARTLSCEVYPAAAFILSIYLLSLIIYTIIALHRGRPYLDTRMITESYCDDNDTIVTLPLNYNKEDVITSNQIDTHTCTST